MPENTENTKPELPATLQALKQIEQSQPVNPVLSANISAPAPADWKQKLKLLLEKLQKQHVAIKVGVGGVILLGVLFVCLFVMYITSIDTTVFKLSLNGFVVNSNQERIRNAVVKLDGKLAVADDEGVFTYDNLEVKRYTIEISADGYETYKQEIAMSRSFLNYVNNRTFELKGAGSASIVGKFISPDPTYQFLDDLVTIGENSYDVRVDGSFEISNLKTGTVEFIFSSINFKDDKRDIELKGGKMDIGEITLIPAGDIVASAVSYIREDIVQDLKVTVEGVPSEQITIDETGKIVIKDLEVARKYKVRTEKTGFQNRDYEVSVNQGENPIFNFKVVETGRFPFIREVDNREQLFVADLDGSNPKQLTQDTKLPRAEYSFEDVVFYLSTRDNISNPVGGDAFTTYVVNIDGGNAQRVTKDITNMGRTVPNFTAQKIANIRRGTTQASRVLEVMNLEAVSREPVHQIESGSYDSVAISDDGKVVYFQVQDTKNKTKGLYRAVIGQTPVKLVEKDNLQIYSVTANGDRVLYSARNASTSLQDLYLYTVSTGQDVTLKPAFTGKQFQFVKGAEDFIIFSDMKDGASNVFQLSISTNTETKLTTFVGGSEGIEAVYQQMGFMVYQTGKGIYVMDLAKPKVNKLVTNDFVRYTGYSL